MPDANPKAFELHAFVPFLMARVGSLMALSFTPRIEQAGITLQKWRVLMVLHFNGPLTLVDVSRITGVKTSTLSRLVGRMVDKRLVTRRRSHADARTVQISLRREGEALFRKLWPEAARLEELVTAPFAASDLERFKEMLREIETILVRQIGAAGRIRRNENNDDDAAVTAS
jgi:DNA-binding MarR family transcriptional regulator